MGDKFRAHFGSGRDPIFGFSADLPRVIELELTEIHPNPDQPRKTFDPEALQELADSIRDKGLIQPIVVKRLDDGSGYLLVAGERRYRAHQLLGKQTVAAIMTQGNADEIALIENIQREDLKPLEEAEAYARMIERYQYTQEELGRVVGKRQNTISEILLLNTLPDRIKDEHRASDVGTKSVLVEIARLKEPERQLSLWDDLKNGNRVTLRAARQRKRGAPTPSELEPPVVRTLALGKAFVRRLQQHGADDFSAHPDQYRALADVKRDLDAYLTALSERLGDQPAGHDEQAS